MKSKLLLASLMAGALAMPLVSFAADSDTDRSDPKAFVKDSVITTKVKAALAESKPDSLLHVHVDTDKNGVVYLSGTAGSERAIATAAKLASSVDGVVSVHNSIKVQVE